MCHKNFKILHINFPFHFFQSRRLFGDIFSSFGIVNVVHVGVIFLEIYLNSIKSLNALKINKSSKLIKVSHENSVNSFERIQVQYRKSYCEGLESGRII
jgi:hypothetical protein